MLVPCRFILRLIVKGFIHRRLRLGGFVTDLATAASRGQNSTAAQTHIIRQPNKPVKTGALLTSSLLRLTAGALQFFGALPVEPLCPF